MSKPRPSKEYQNFVRLADRLLAVPRADAAEAHRRSTASKPHRIRNKRGPKPKGTVIEPSASGHEEA